MTRYASMFERCAAQERGAIVPFVMLGDPTPASCEAIIETLIADGADALELGIPFSDPVADGVVIQEAHLRALQALFCGRILRTLTRWVVAQAQQGTGAAPWRDKTRPARTVPGRFGIKLPLHTPSHRMCGTKLALLAQNGPIWLVLPAQGELFHAHTHTRPSRADFLASTPQPHSR